MDRIRSIALSCDGSAKALLVCHRLQVLVEIQSIRPEVEAFARPMDIAEISKKCKKLS